MQIQRDERATPLSLETYRRMRSAQLRYERDRDADADATMVGFLFGLAAATVFWLLISGQGTRMLAALVRAVLVVGGPS